MSALSVKPAFIQPNLGVRAAPKWVRLHPVDARELGRRVRAARAYADLSNEELAAAVEIGRSTLVKIESGKREPRTWELWAIAEVCGVPREFFESERLSLDELETVADAAAELEADEETAAQRSSPNVPTSEAEANGSQKPAAGEKP